VLSYADWLAPSSPRGPVWLWIQRPSLHEVSGAAAVMALTVNGVNLPSATISNAV
jgi:hypothetical protein